MIITKHIAFYYKRHRVCYVNTIIEATNKYEHTTDIFIHTNNPELLPTEFIPYTNGKIQIVFHDLSGIDPKKLIWKCRDLMFDQRNEYDIFIFVEDDILIPFKAIQYWQTYNEGLISFGYNVGFIRIEVKNDTEYITDLWGYENQLDTFIKLNNKIFCLNNKNPYCAFWIYNKNEFNKFANSIFYDPATIEGYGIQEMGSVGLHGLSTKWYKATLIPIKNNNLMEDCKVYHLPNNYVNDNTNLFATVKFTESIKNTGLKLYSV